MSQSPNLSLPYIQAAQAQKHITHNEALRALDAIVQLSVLDRDLNAPPLSPADGARYLVAGSPTGAWAGHAGAIAAWQDGAWAFYVPRQGWVTWIADEAQLVSFNGTNWIPVQATQNVPMFGINATADTTNRLNVRSAASLFDNAGNGHQHKINKAAAGDTASLLFQTNYSGRAEFGLAGDDKFRVKVSADGSTWNEAIVADPAGWIETGGIKWGKAITLANSTDLNTVTVSGFYDGNALSNTPGGSTSWFYLAVQRHANSADYVCQTATTLTQNPPITFTRVRVGGTWGAWQEARLPGTDNAFTLGSASLRWSAVYAANGTIQTSDARDKVVVGGLNFAGDLVDAVDPVLFRWKVGGNRIALSQSETMPDDEGNAIAEPGPVPEPVAGVRTHAGFVAQDLKSAMDAVGTDFAAWGLDDRHDPKSRQWTRPDQLIAVLWSALRETRAEVRKLRE